FTLIPSLCPTRRSSDLSCSVRLFKSSNNGFSAMFDSPILCITSIYVNFVEKFHATPANYNAKHCEYSNLRLSHTNASLFDNKKCPFMRKRTLFVSLLLGERLHTHTSFV